MNNKKIHAFFMVAAMVFVMASCTERIELDLEGDLATLVIDARITDIDQGSKVIITKTTSYFFNQPPPMAAGARVMLSADKGSWLLKEESPGKYILPLDFSADHKSTYTLEVDFADEVFHAHSTMPKPVSLDSLSIRPHDWLSGRFDLLIHFRDPPETDNFYMWKVYRNDVLLTDSLLKVPFTDGEPFKGRYVSAPVYVLQPEDGILQSGDVYRVETYSITEEYYEFLLAMLRNQGATGGPFAGPPSNIPSNFSNGALGFFMTAAVTSAEIAIP